MGQVAQTPVLWPQRPKELIAPAPRSSAVLGMQLPTSKFLEGRQTQFPSRQSEVFRADLLSVSLLSLGKVAALSYPEEMEHEGQTGRDLGHSHCSGSSGWGMMELCLWSSSVSTLIAEPGIEP